MARHVKSLADLGYLPPESTDTGANELLIPDVTGANGQRAAERINDLLDGEPTAAELREAMELMESGVPARIRPPAGRWHADRRGTGLPHPVLRGVGANVFELPVVIRDDDTDLGEDDQRQMLGALRQGILALSDESIDGVGFDDSRTDGTPYGLPDEIRDLVTNSAVEIGADDAGTGATGFPVIYTTYGVPQFDEFWAATTMLAMSNAWTA